LKYRSSFQAETIIVSDIVKDRSHLMYELPLANGSLHLNKNILTNLMIDLNGWT